MPAIPSNSLIAIPGISGYVASYVGLTALQSGHRVRGIVRSLERAESLKSAYLNHGIQNIDGCLEFVVLDDLGSVEKLRKAFEGVDGVVYSAFLWDTWGDVTLVDVAIANMRSMLQAAKLVPSLKRVVITSSIAATVSMGEYHDKVLTGEDWNDYTPRCVAEAVAAGETPRPMDIYATAKVNAEKAAWTFMSDEKPHFDIVCILPGTCIGPVLHGDPPSSASWIAGLFKNDNSMVKSAGLPLFAYIDIRDCGRIHFESLINPGLGGQRLLCGSGPHGWDEILTLMRRIFPNVETIAAEIGGFVGETWPQKIDTTRARELIGRYIALEQSLADSGRALGY